MAQHGPNLLLLLGPEIRHPEPGTEQDDYEDDDEENRKQQRHENLTDLNNALKDVGRKLDTGSFQPFTELGANSRRAKPAEYAPVV